MKNKTFIKLIDDILNNIVITNYDSCSYVNKMRLHDCIHFYESFEDKKDKEYYFKEIKFLLKAFNVNLNINFNQIELEEGY